MKKVKKAKKKTAKPAKKKVKKAAGKSKAAKKKEKEIKPIGKVTHFYTHIKVAVIKFKVPFKAGGKVRIKGATTDFEQALASIQYDHKPVKAAKKGQGVGVKLSKRVREGDLVYPVK